jgi:hypothetical protein
MELDVSDIDINQYWVNITRFCFIRASITHRRLGSAYGKEAVYICLELVQLKNSLE